MRDAITDDLHLRIPAKNGGHIDRMWSIRSPRVSVGATLLAKIAAAVGPEIQEVARRVLLADPALAEGIEEIQEGKAARKDEEIVRLIRNAKAGRAIRGLAGRKVLDAIDVTDAQGRTAPVLVASVGMLEASAALSAVVLWATSLGLDLSSERLYGKIEHGRVAQPGYLWTLAHACDLHLRYDSRSHPPGSPAAADLGATIEQAHGAGVIEWIEAMDDIVISIDELHLLWAFCLVHTLRPF